MKHTCITYPNRFMLLPMLCLVVSACDTAPTVVDQRFGNAVKQAQAQQTLHTEPRPCMQGMGAETCKGREQQRQHKHMHAQVKDSHDQQADTDGVTAQAAVDRYQESFRAPPPPAPVFRIGLGSTTTR